MRYEHRTHARRRRAYLGVITVAALGLAACGGDDDASPAPAAPEETTGSPQADEGGAPDDAGEPESPDDDASNGASPDEPDADGPQLSGEAEVAAGTVVDLDACPRDWDPTEGITSDSIRIGWTGPESGPLAAFGQIPVGMEAYFDWVNDTDPIEGKNLVLVTRDDGYEAGRAVANVEEMIETDDIFAFVHTIGTATSAAIRPITHDECVPQLFNSSGFPAWGDPATWPWTIGFLLDYLVEAEIWCNTIVDELGEGATVAALFMNNDFGRSYQTAVQGCADDGRITLIAEELHDQAAPDVSNEMTTMVASGAQAFLGGTSAAFCPQAVASIAASDWRPQFYISSTCENLASFFAPVIDQTGQLAEEGSGVRMVKPTKTCGDARYEDDPAIQFSREVLRDYGGGIECEDGSYSTGIIYGEIVEKTLRAAAELPGGLNRLNVITAMWNLDETSDLMLAGGWRTDGVNDAFLTESGQINEVVVVDGALEFNPVADAVDFEGASGSWSSG